MSTAVVIDPALLPELIEAHLPEHLPHRRWAGLQGLVVRSVRLRWHEVIPVGDALLVWALADAVLDDGTDRAYQVFVGVRPARPEADFLHGKEAELLARVVGLDGDGPSDIVLYDALIDPDLAVAVLHLVDPDAVVGVRRPLVLEHSNSSVVFDEARILKIVRKVEPGPNPDVEITRVLAERGFSHVLEPLAELRRDGTDLAVLRRYLVGATEGWHLARTSVRDLLASRLAPAACGADFARDAERLGMVVARLHLAMADAWGAEPGDAQQWSREMLDGLRTLLDVPGGVHPAEVDVAAVGDCFERIASLADAGQAIRIHGDLHLAQVLLSDAGWFVLDFEGEPNRRRADRFTTSSPLRDVAGILRSLHYAAASGLVAWAERESEADPHLAELADAWEARNGAAFLAGYGAVAGVDELLPASVTHRDTLRATFQLDKAVYELGYELRYRPELASIPSAGIARLVERLNEP